ncbi:MAG: DUF1232 domain-containing protein [Planctomycetota bacterium]
MGLATKLGPLGRALAFWRVLRNPAVPVWGRVLFVVASVAYLMMPFDVVTDLIPVVGWIDDLIALPLFAWLFGQLLPGLFRRSEK